MGNEFGRRDIKYDRRRPGIRDSDACLLYTSIRAAEEVNEPVILMVNRDAARHMPLDILGPILTTLAKQAKVPVDVHLDHSVDLESIAKAVDAGFTSVMFDGSQLSFEENVDKTLKTIALARPKNISVEAEIGSVAYSDPSIQAKMI